MHEGGFKRLGDAPATPRAAGVRLLGNQAPTLLLLLSLNLLLIVFFVVLNSNTTTDSARERSVLSSVARSFGAGEPDGTVLRVRPAAKVAAQDALRTSVSAAFAAVLEGRDVLVRNQTDRFSVTTPLSVFYDLDGESIKPALPVLNRLVEILATPPDDFRIEMTVTVNHTADDAARAPARAASMAIDLLRRDVEPASFAVGTAQGDAASLTFMFDVLPIDADQGGATP